MRSREARSAPPGADQAHGLRQWWLNRSLRTKGMIVVAVPLMAVVGLTSANLLLQQDESHERDISTNARNLAAAASQVLADAANAETGIRGYTATRDPLFLAPYTLTLTRIGAERKALREAAVIAGAGRQQRAVAAAGRPCQGKGVVPASAAKIRCQPRYLSGEPHSGAGEREGDHGPAAPPGRRSHRRYHRRVGK